MSNFSKKCLLVIFAVCLLPGLPLLAEDGITGNLVVPKWLEKNLKNANLVLLDASPAQIYTAKHIAGAVNVDIYAFSGREESPADMEKLYQSWGVSPGKKVVIYDQGGSMLATRVFFSLYSHGFAAKDLLLLDGGLSKWQEAGLPVTKDVPPVANRGSFKITKSNDDARAKLPEVLAASGDTANNALVEALGADWHYGQVSPFNRPGHIPNSVLLPSADFYNADKTFKSPEEITRMLAYFGVRPEQQIYTYCGGGVAASVPFFALKFILNYPKVKLYTDSELGWLSDERQLPFWTYDAPFLMRDAAWVNWWGGPRMRMFLGARISIIDVRPAEAYAAGHLPFALNVPADVFKNNLARPAKLAEILGAAGVEPAQEAVVVSGAGLTKDAALAFAALQKLGQRRVSVFTDSSDKWAQLGVPVTTQPTAVGPNKGPQDPSTPPVQYTAKARKDVVIADANSTHGVYPKVFIASGKDVPAKAQDGKIVHVPYTDLLNADGTPKAAKDIWTILTKAGVPRYAEVVCVSDDPGEAAVNYFVFKLMGYPDVKVLMM